MSVSSLSGEKRKLYILLTRFPGLDSDALRWWTRFPYTHASIGLEEDMNTFYSFVVKGFIVEDISRYNSKPGRAPFPCALYELEVCPAVYEKAKQILMKFVSNRANLHYNTLGMLLSLIKIPMRRQSHYFCSHFVAELLQRCDGAQLSKRSTLYLPRDLQRLGGIRMIFQGDLLRMSHQYPALG
ncbi:MAG: hypothetical protein IJW14_04870 [Oscillospiraceae bacterium]|nr:hypothetical protein [Oscillospiraceae bacterium]